MDIITNFYPDDVPRARGYNLGTIFGRLAPKIWEGKKAVQNFSRVLTTFDFDREYLRNESTNRKSKKVVDQLRPLPRWAKKVFELWSTNEEVIDVSIDPPKCTFFGRLYFRP